MLDLTKTSQDLINEFLSKIKQDLLDYMDGKLFAGEFANDSDFTRFSERNATGASKRSIQIANVSSDSGQIIGADHIEYVFRGRGPGKMPPLNKIIDWCVARGLPRSKAWIIAKKISEKGTLLHRRLKAIGKNSVIDSVITKEIIEDFINRISKDYILKIDSEISNIFTR